MTKRRKVLIVEDELVLRDAYRLILTAAGFDVDTANNGAEGLREAAKFRPDIILLDIFMPVLDGKEFLKNIDKKDYADTTIIVFSNLSDKETEREVIRLGADKFVLKSSTSPAELIEILNGE